MKNDKINKSSFLAFLFCIFTLYSFSQKYQAMVKLDTNAILIGDQVNFSLSFTFPSGSLVRWPQIGDTILGKIDVIERSAIDTTFSTDKSTVTLHQKLLLTSFDSGFYTIPPVRFYYIQPPDTTLRNEPSQTLFLSVHTIAVDTTREIKPIKGPMMVPLTFREILPWILLGIFFIIITWFIIYFIRKRKRSEPIFQLKPRIQLLPHEIALGELEKLRVKKLWQTGKIKEYHTELTDIIRNYIEERFQVAAMESTSGEILHDLLEHPEVSGFHQDQLGQILTLADLVKFAKAQPLPAENESCLAYAVDFVKSTVPVVIPESQLKPAISKE